MKYMKLILFAGVYFLSSAVMAQPFISAVDTSQLGSGKLTINGNGFGPGPSVNLFDNFESTTANAGDAIPVSSPIIGSWSSVNKPVPYTTQAHSGKFSAKMVNNPQFRLDFSTGVQEAFVSAWVRVPNGTNFPGATSPGVFPDVSSWKFGWLIDLDYLGNSSDLVTISHIGKGNFHTGGNDYTILRGLGNSWWSWNSWVRLAVWVRANPTNPTSTGDILIHTVSQEKGVGEGWFQQPVFDSDGPALKEYKYLNIPGWVRSNSPLYDDIYVASGPNALAHVELTDSANYDQSHIVAIQPSTSWSSGKITVDTNQGGFPDLNNVYLFVWDKDGNRNATGYPLSAGMSPPMYPSNIH
ncbi:MAG TPA: hypothetical protein VET88_03880 [Gammaproteobacteria bacterium]|nr:hypothetical protein [Gammaproteobacteria bacterium]